MKKIKGFTIIEILIVISIIAILASIVFIIVPNSKEKSRDLIRKNHTSQLYLAIELYNNQVGQLPDLGDPNCLSITIPNTDCYASSSNLNDKWKILLSQLAPYIDSVEPDPCPDCQLSNSFFSKLFAEELRDNYEYVYEAPAMILAVINQNGINPETVGFKANSYRIYAKNLEREEGHYSFGINLGENNEGNDTLCPYGENEKECTNYFDKMCEGEGSDYMIGCEWLWDNNQDYCKSTKCYDLLIRGKENLCLKENDINACEWLWENSMCKEDCINILKEEETNLCLKENDINACEWLWENSMCKEDCINILKEEETNLCLKENDINACEWLWNHDFDTCKETDCYNILVNEKNRLCKEEEDKNACEWLKQNGF